MVMHEDCCVNLSSWPSLARGKFKTSLWESIFFVVIWSLWFEQNQVKFCDKEFVEARVVEQIKQRTSEWVVFSLQNSHMPLGKL